jgi:hypothetical protein
MFSIFIKFKLLLYFIKEKTVEGNDDTTDSAVVEPAADTTNEQKEADDVKIAVNEKATTQAPAGNVTVKEITEQTVTEIDTKLSTLVQQETTTVVKEETTQNSSMSLFTDFKKRPRFVIPPFSQWSMKDTPLKLEVEVTKSPDMKVNWYHDDKLVVPGGTCLSSPCIIKAFFSYNNLSKINNN